MYRGRFQKVVFLYLLKKINSALESARRAEFILEILQLMKKINIIKNIVKLRFLLSGVNKWCPPIGPNYGLMIPLEKLHLVEHPIAFKLLVIIFIIY